MMQDLTMIVPSFAMQAQTRHAVDSIAIQSPDVAIIVVDDASDPPITLSEETVLRKNVRLIRHDTNRGAAAARNTGVSAATTGWVGFLDADDCLLPDTLERRLHHALNHARADMAARPTLYGCGWIEPARDRVRIPNGADTPAQFASGCWFAPGSCVLGPRTLFIDLPFATGYDRLEDFDWSIRFGMAGGRLDVLDIAGTTLAPGYNARYDAVRNSARIIAETFRHMRHDDLAVWRNLNAYLELELAACAYGQSRWLATSLHLARSLRFRPRTKLHFSPGWSTRPVDHE